MKRLINFIKEVHRKDYSLKNTKDKLYTEYSYKYFEYLNNNDKLSKALEATFKNINDNILQIMNDNHISSFINAKMN